MEKFIELLKPLIFSISSEEIEEINELKRECRQTILNYIFVELYQTCQELDCEQRKPNLKNLQSLFSPLTEYQKIMKEIQSIEYVNKLLISFSSFIIYLKIAAIIIIAYAISKNSFPKSFWITLALVAFPIMIGEVLVVMKNRIKYELKSIASNYSFENVSRNIESEVLDDSLGVINEALSSN